MPNQIWFITGSSRGFGRSLVSAALKAGDSEVATTRRPDQLAEFVEQHGDRVLPIALDVTDVAAVHAALKTAVNCFGRIDVLVNNAGFADVSPIERTTDEDFRTQFETNLWGVYNVSKAAIAILRAQGGGTLVQFSSVGGRVGGNPGLASYQAAKFAVDGFSRCLATETAAFGIKVLVVEPSGFATDWAGSSMTVQTVPAEYETTVGALLRLMRESGAAGDPVRAAEILVRVVKHPNLPSHLLLGGYAQGRRSTIPGIRLKRQRRGQRLAAPRTSDSLIQSSCLPRETSAEASDGIAIRLAVRTPSLLLRHATSRIAAGLDMFKTTQVGIQPKPGKLMHFAHRAMNLHAQKPHSLICFRLLPVLLSVLLVTMPVTAQQEDKQEAATTIKKDVNVVNVLATVRNKQGQIVNDLTKDDFKLEVDGHSQAIKYFAKVTDLPLTLGLLVDTSLSQRRVLDKERTASYTFLNDLLDQTRDKAFIVHFDFDIELLQDLTSSRPKLEAALQKLQVPEPRQMQTSTDPGQMRGGGTKLYDAVFLASDEVTSKVQGRKALIILSDGVDQGSKESLPAAIEAAQRANTLVYTILFSDPDAYNNMAGGSPGRHGGGFPGGGYPGGGYPGRYPGGGYPGGGYPGGGGGRYPGGGGGGRGSHSHADGKAVMQQLAQQTGGRFFEVSKKESIDDIYKTIGEELRNQYNLGFTPDQAAAESGYHKLTVTTTKKDMTVQAREGYYSGK